MTALPHYLSWRISDERQRHEWLHMRRSIMAVRLAFLVGGHVAYFGLCALAHHFGKFQEYGHSIWVAFWSMASIGMVLYLFETLYTRTWRIEQPRYAIRQNGVTLYGDDGPCAHYDWSHKPVLHIESDKRLPHFRSLILSTARRNKWLRRASRVSIPLPSPEDLFDNQRIDETHIVHALRQATEDRGLKWVTSANGEIVLC
ncbi:MAG: hypothetical protein WCT04_08845 [Planctomycetota bacterium]